MYHQGAALKRPFSSFGTAQHKNVLSASMLVERHTAAGWKRMTQRPPVIPIDTNQWMSRRYETAAMGYRLVFGDFE